MTILTPSGQVCSSEHGGMGAQAPFLLVPGSCRLPDNLFRSLLWYPLFAGCQPKLH